jgi:hypothetical protein
MVDGPLETIKERILQGDRDGARQQLVGYLKMASDDVDAWALLASLVTEPAEQLVCYRQVLRIDPGNRQAAAWIGSLTAGLSATSQSAEPREELIEQAPAVDADPLDAVLAGLELPDSDSDASEQAWQSPLTETSGPSSASALDVESREQQSSNGLLSRLSQALEPEAGLPSFPEEGRPDAATVTLAPEEILRLAGGPLPEEDRIKCPTCGAVVSRTQTRCAWCSSPLPGD